MAVSKTSAVAGQRLQPFGSAIVVGAGIAGLLAARVLSEFFNQVTVLERDTTADAGRYRSGVPQGHHVHVLMARGVAGIEELFPGIFTELGNAGAPTFDPGERVLRLFPHGSLPNVPIGAFAQAFSRPLLEGRLRDRITGLPGVRLRQGCKVVGLLAESGRVTGVVLRDGGAAAPVIRQADLVVDATGHGSRLPEWLSALGLPPAVETVVDARVTYASRVYENSTPHRAPWNVLIEYLQAPANRRGCIVAHIEGNQLMVTLQGAGGEAPPHDPADFEAFVRTLRGPLAETIRPMSPATPVYRFARTANRRVLYHKMPSWPGGLIVMGDAACRFNPVYAQGMTVATLEALLLRKALRHCRTHPGLSGFSRGFQRRLARLTQWPWLWSTAGDWGWIHDRQPPFAIRCIRRYLRQWLRLATQDPATARQFTRLVNMLDGPLTLIRPTSVTRILTGITGSWFAAVVRRANTSSARVRPRR